MSLVQMAEGSKVKEEIEKQKKIVPKRNHISINSVRLYFSNFFILVPQLRRGSAEPP